MFVRENTKAYFIDSMKVTVIFSIFVAFVKMCSYKIQSKDGHIAKSLLEQAYKWNSISEQDQQPLYSLQHSNYAIAYLNAARHTSDDTTLERMSGLDIHKLYKKIDENNKTHLKALNQKTVKHKKIQNQPSWIS